MATLGRRKPDTGCFLETGRASKYQETDRAVLLLWTFVKKRLGSQWHRVLEGSGSAVCSHGGNLEPQTSPGSSRQGSVSTQALPSSLQCLRPGTLPSVP